jgi:hypothetical protein
MARNGSGVYSLPPSSTVSDGDTATASQHNTPLLDLQSDANTARPIVAGGTGATTASGARTALGLNTMATQAASAVAVTGGTVAGVAVTGSAIDSTALGGTTPAAGAFTTVSTTGAATLASAGVTGALTAGSATVTGDVASATGTFSGAVTAASFDAAGDVAGVTGTFSGTVTANAFSGDGSGLSNLGIPDVAASVAAIAVTGIGSTLVAWNSTATSYSAGDSVSGSDLYYATSLIPNDLSPFDNISSVTATFPTSGVTALSGTWKALSYSVGRAGTNPYVWKPALFKRVS